MILFSPHGAIIGVKSVIWEKGTYIMMSILTILKGPVNMSVRVEFSLCAPLWGGRLFQELR